MDNFKTLVKEQGIVEGKIITKPDQGNDDTDTQQGGGSKDFFKKGVIKMITNIKREHIFGNVLNGLGDFVSVQVTAFPETCSCHRLCLM